MTSFPATDMRMEKPDSRPVGFMCAGCGGSRSTAESSLREGSRHVLRQCRACGLAHIRPFPDGTDDPYQTDSLDHYDQAVRPLREGFRYHHQRLLAFLSSRIPDRANILEVGCGSGDFLRTARARGYGCWGVEPAWVAGPENESWEVHMVRARIEEAVIPEGFFNAAVAVQVIEHTHDPQILVQKMALSLKPGGWLVLETPNYSALARRWKSSAFSRLNVAPGHWHLFTPRALTNLLRRFHVTPHRVDTYFKALSIYGRGRWREGAVSLLNGTLGSWGWGNTLWVAGRK